MKPQFSLTSTFREAYNMAQLLRWRFLAFILMIFMSIFAAQAIADLISQAGGLTSHFGRYLNNWLVRPICAQFILALIVALINFNGIFNQFKIKRKGEGTFFDHFSRLFFVGLAVFYITDCVLIFASYPALADKLTLGERSLDGLFGMLFYMASTVSLFFSYFYVMVYNYRPSHALRNSFLSTKPHWAKILVIVLLQFISFALIYILISTPLTRLWAASSFATVDMIFAVELALGILLAFWLYPILMCVFLITFRDLAIVD